MVVDFVFPCFLLDLVLVWVVLVLVLPSRSVLLEVVVESVFCFLP